MIETIIICCLFIVGLSAHRYIETHKTSLDDYQHRDKTPEERAIKKHSTFDPETGKTKNYTDERP